MAAAISLVAVFGMALPEATPAVASAETAVATSDEALRRDATTYSAEIAVTVDEAIRRLEMQTTIGELQEQLATEHSDIFAGLYIDHQPEFSITIRLTDTNNQVVAEKIQSSLPGEIVEMLNSKLSLNELESIRIDLAGAAMAADIPHHTNINIRTNTVELLTLSTEAARNSLEPNFLYSDLAFEYLEVNELAKPVANIYGGLYLHTTTWCTSGFSVHNSSGTNGITTAGHCTEPIKFSGVTLPFKSGTSGGTYDIQWNSEASFTATNQVFDGTLARFITGLKFRSAQSVGNYVCKYGVTSGYSCGFILDKDFDGVNIRVSTSVSGGDSGGPFFISGNAYGTTISYIGSDSIYGPIDHIYNILGLTIKTS